MKSYEIASGKKEQLLTDGYCLLPGALPPDLLSRWRELADKLEADAMDAHSKGEALHGACVIEDPVGPRLMRYNDVLGVDADAALDLLACPAMMAVARELCGPGTVPLQMDIVFKQQHPHPVIGWHQGAPHPRGYPYLNVGIYLDDAGAGDGCVRYIPRTQHELQNICAFIKNHGWDIPGVVEQPAQAGDILVQDMMILHGSEPKRSPGVRRTIYVELRPAEGIAESGVQSEHWKELRKRWMGIVARRAGSADFHQEFREELPDDLASDDEEIAAILECWEPPIPAVYCNEDIESTDYPVPFDLSEDYS